MLRVVQRASPRRLRAPRVRGAVLLALACAALPASGGDGQLGTSPAAGRAAAAGSTSPSFDGRLRVATLNMWGVSLPLGIDWADHIDARFDRLRDHLRENREGLDVVLLQELWKRSARRRLLEDPAVQARFPYRIDVDEQHGGSGLAVLSRHPIAQQRTRFHRFERCGAWWKVHEGDCLGRKGLLLFQIEVGATRVWLANTHTIACYPEGSRTECDQTDPNGRYRWDQIHAIRDFVAGVAGPEPVIVGGDFNFTRTSRYYAAQVDPARRAALQREDDFADSLARHAPDRAWVDVTEPGAPPGRLDYLWVRPGDAFTWMAVEPAAPILTERVRVEDGGRVPLSDHPAIAATFCRVRRGEQPPRCRAP